MRRLACFRLPPRLSPDDMMPLARAAFTTTTTARQQHPEQLPTAALKGSGLRRPPASAPPPHFLQARERTCGATKGATQP